VTTGLYAGFMSPQVMSAATRLQGALFWDFVIYAIEDLVFLITGLQARALMSGIGSAIDCRSGSSPPWSSARW
jgi:hypothetical protein